MVIQLIFSWSPSGTSCMGVRPLRPVMETEL